MFALDRRRRDDIDDDGRGRVLVMELNLLLNGLAMMLNAQAAELK